MLHEFSEYEDEYIISNYKNMTMKEIALNLNLTDSQIRHRIQRHLKISPSKRKKHFFNIDLFKNESPDKYYVIGLICADGNLYNGKNRRHKVSISLHSDDRDLLVQINKKLCDTNIVYDRKTTKMSELVVYSPDIYNILTSFGIAENKSLNLKFPTIPKKYLKDFIRGYFDGDGSLSVSKNGNYEKLTIQFLGTDEFLTSLAKVMDDKFGFGIKNVNDTKTNIKCLRYFTKQAREILSWLYDTNNLKLDRKYIKFKNYMDKFND